MPRKRKKTRSQSAPAVFYCRRVQWSNESMEAAMELGGKKGANFYKQGSIAAQGTPFYPERPLKWPSCSWY